MRYLGIDFGLKRIGLATSDGELASPLKVIEAKNLEDATRQVADLVKKEQIEVVVVGKPESGSVTSAVEKFTKKFAALVGVEIKVVDETLSTQRVQQLNLEMGLKKKHRRISDAQAAAEILQNYLDSLK